MKTQSTVFANAGRSAVYKSDGTGRDQYINRNSGGFTIPNDPQQYPPISMICFTLYQLCIASFISPKSLGGTTTEGFFKPANFTSKIIQYHQNGSGRDTYIM